MSFLLAGASDAGAASPDSSSSSQGKSPPRKGEPALKKYMQQFDQQRLLEMTKIVVSYQLGQWITLSGEVPSSLEHKAVPWIASCFLLQALLHRHWCGHGGAPCLLHPITTVRRCPGEACSMRWRCGPVRCRAMRAPGWWRHRCRRCLETSRCCKIRCSRQWGRMPPPWRTSCRGCRWVCAK